MTIVNPVDDAESGYGSTTMTTAPSSSSSNGYRDTEALLVVDQSSSNNGTFPKTIDIQTSKFTRGSALCMAIAFPIVMLSLIVWYGTNNGFDDDFVIVLVIVFIVLELMCLGQVFITRRFRIHADQNGIDYRSKYVINSFSVPWKDVKSIVMTTGPLFVCRIPFVLHNRPMMQLDVCCRHTGNGNSNTNDDQYSYVHTITEEAKELEPLWTALKEYKANMIKENTETKLFVKKSTVIAIILFCLLVPIRLSASS